MFPIINIGPLAIQANGLILLVCLLVGLWVMGRFSKNLGTAGNKIENCILIGLIIGIVSARIGFMLQNLSIFLDDPLSLISLTPSMFNPDFGVLVGFLSAFILAQKQNLPLWPSLDTISPIALWIYIGIHLASFADGSTFGLPTQLPWGLEIWGAYRHPVQIYVITLSAGLFIWMWIKTSGFSQTGFLHSGALFNITSVYLALFSIFTQAFAAQDDLLWHIKLSQLIGFLVLLVSLGLIYFGNYKEKNQQSVIIGVGSNFHQEEIVPKAISEIGQYFRVRRKSSIYQTRAVNNDVDNARYWNMVIEVGTKLSYPDLRTRLKLIEKKFCRKAGEKKHITLDLDILVFAHEVFKFERKTIPDPDILKYQYIAKPISEMSPTFRHPADGRSISEILESMPDQTENIKISEVPDGP